MIDSYSKVVMTIIAGALLALVFQNGVQRASAQRDGCGLTQRDPCYVSVALDCGSAFVGRTFVDGTCSLTLKP